MCVWLSITIVLRLVHLEIQCITAVSDSVSDTMYLYLPSRWPTRPLRSYLTRLRRPATTLEV